MALRRSRMSQSIGRPRCMPHRGGRSRIGSTSPHCGGLWPTARSPCPSSPAGNDIRPKLAATATRRTGPRRGVRGRARGASRLLGHRPRPLAGHLHHRMPPAAPSQPRRECPQLGTWVGSPRATPCTDDRYLVEEIERPRAGSETLQRASDTHAQESALGPLGAGAHRAPGFFSRQSAEAGVDSHSSEGINLSAP